MEHSGVKPDVVCWTSRVHGLIECNKGEAALRALDDMGRRWVQAVVKTHGDLKNKHMQTIGDMDDIPKPSIETINAAITGFIRRKDPEQAYRVLGWAAKFCINPDVTTYNILLRPLIKEGRAKKAAALLGQMHKAGLQADIVTFTIILDEILRTSESSTPEALKETISEVFNPRILWASPALWRELVKNMQILIRFFGIE
ncbi:putative Pentatricopeptide repeat-containing protein, mitochondrial [Glarea lozoyensis 74030]|uniref:Putative Pentatricopeptide repeat-containing protein, mitochondrial n=1 Tax=Glarea lozoyensis (strain ATCC 74030 / MF5533) TaxID=1104152 RepID=H0EMA3_GLAL7|nr:putative Pentatricopeptide repeat-containing protein, mitochondrial [Glarea lozoyensis 74030]